MIREDFVRISGLLGLRCFPSAPSLPPAPSSVVFLFLTTIDDSPSSLIITSRLPPFQSGLVRRISSTCLRIAGSESPKDRTNENDVSDSAEVRVQLVNGLSRK